MLPKVLVSGVSKQKATADLVAAFASAWGTNKNILMRPVSIEPRVSRETKFVDSRSMRYVYYPFDTWDSADGKAILDPKGWELANGMEATESCVYPFAKGCDLADIVNGLLIAIQCYCVHINGDPTMTGIDPWIPKAGFMPDGASEWKRFGGKHFDGPCSSINCSVAQLGAVLQWVAASQFRAKDGAYEWLPGYVKMNDEGEVVVEPIFCATGALKHFVDSSELRSQIPVWVYSEFIGREDWMEYDSVAVSEFGNLIDDFASATYAC